MTQEMFAALIGALGAVIAALIGAFGALAAAEVKGKGQRPGCGVMGLLVSTGALIGLIVGVLVLAPLVIKIFNLRFASPAPEMAFTPTNTAQPVITALPTVTATLLSSSSFPTLRPTLPSPPTSTTAPSPAPTPTSSPSIESFCPPIGSPEAMFSAPLDEMGIPIGAPVGTGVFEHAVRAFGTKPTSYRYAKDAMEAHPCIQYLTPSVLPNPQGTRHCMTSFYHTNRIWVGSVLKGTSVVIKRAESDSYETIGRMDVVPPDTRAYIVEYEIQAGDEICIEAPVGKVLAQVVQAGGYHLWIGRDLTTFTDSWCLLLENDNSRHWCQ